MEEIMLSSAQRYKKYHVNRRQDVPTQSGPGLLWLTLAAVMFLGCWAIALRDDPSPMSKPAASVHWKWKTERARKIADLWSITPEEAGQPVVLWKNAD
jgi:hypothetical protein